MIANLLGALAVRRVPWLRATPGPGPRRLLRLLPPQLHRSAGYSSRSYSSSSSNSSRSYSSYSSYSSSSNDEESCNSGSKGSYSSSYSSRSNATDNSGSVNSCSGSSNNNNSSNSDSSGSRYDNASCDINSCSRSSSSFGDGGGTDINSSNSCSSSRSGSGSDGRSSSSSSISSKSISSSSSSISSSNIIISSSSRRSGGGVSLSRRGGAAESPSAPVCRRQLLSSMAANQSKIDWNSWEKAKDQLTKLKDLEERRKYYKCSSNYIMLKSLDKWSEKELHSQDKLTELEKPGGREYEVNHQINDKVSLFKGDITLLEIDAIVNAANSTLLGGGGVDGCIHRSAGSLLKEECRSLGGCSTGKAKITCGYRLPSKYVIHTVGPRVLDSVPTPEERKQLDGCYSECLHIVEDKELRSVAFPCISTGIYGFPNEPAARIALETTRNWLEKYHSKVDRIIFCLFLPIDVELYDTLMPVYFPRAPKESSEGVADGPAVAGTENESDDKDRDPEVADEDELKDEDMPSQDQDSAPNKTSAPKCVSKI